MGGGSSTNLATVSGTGENHSWFSWVSNSTSDVGVSAARGVTCGCGKVSSTNVDKDECFFPDKSSCKHFYHCHKITAYHKICPSNLYWNQKKGECDWPDQVVCNVPSGNSNAVGTVSGNSNGVSGGGGMMHMGRMIHVESELNSDSPISTSSSSITNTGCEGDNCPEVTSDGLGGIFLNVHPSYECDTSVNEKVKDPESCGRFIQCMDGLAYHFACQENLFWSSELKICTGLSVAKCEAAENKKEMAESNSNTEKSEGNLCPSGFKGLLPDESNCRRYISCSEN